MLESLHTISGKPYLPLEDLRLHFLDEKTITQIDRALAQVGPYGEVHLIKHKGKLRVIRKWTSEAISK